MKPVLLFVYANLLNSAIGATSHGFPDQQQQSPALVDQERLKTIKQTQQSGEDEIELTKTRTNPVRGQQQMPDRLISTTGEEICQSVVKTANGLVRGKYVKTATGNDVCAFLGIPYAKPPLGQLRFKRPQPVENWEGIYEATEFSWTCTQTAWARSLIGLNHNVSEDCLQLNIWVPVLALKNKGIGTGSPLMVWIHEGGFSVGSSTNPSQNGAVLAGETDVIVASMQYRLGPLGFLYFGCEDAPGNMGLLDQNLALRWINDNIVEFGGNKEITLFGESAGAFSINYHLLSPLSQDLFKRGIMMSGAGTSSLCTGSKAEAVALSYEVAESVGCWSPEDIDDPNRSLSDVLQCMRNTDKFQINEFLKNEQKFIDVTALVIPDGYFLADTIPNLLKSSKNARADMIVGNTAHEGSLFLLNYYSNYLSGFAEPSISYDTFVTLLRDMFRDRPIYEQDAIISHYTNWKNVDDTDANIRRLVAAAGDYSFVCPAVDFAKKWSSKGFNVYYYWFTHRPEESALQAKWLGAYHTADIDYIFGKPLQKSRLNEKNLSKEVQELFTNFVKTGIPSKNWSPYTAAYPVFLDLNATLISDKTPSNIFGPQAEDCAFWNVELPRLRLAYETCHADGCSKDKVRGQPCSI